MSEHEVGAIIARRIWEWLQEMKQVTLVPGVTDPKSPSFDAIKTANMAGTHETLDALEEFIRETTKELRS